MTERSPYEEQALINSFSQGDRAAFETLYRRFFPSLYYYAKRFVEDDQAAEDISTEVFIKLWDHHADFHNLKNLQNFLYLSTRNSCLNFLRGEKRKHQREENWATELQAGEEPGSEEIRAIVHRQILAEVDKMPKQLREIFKLAYTEGLSNEEIANRLEISYSTVKNHKTILLNRLREKFSGKDLLLFLLFYQALGLKKID